MSEAKDNYFPSLDGLRAISVLLVILIHLNHKSPVISAIPGWLGVDFFFVISGFLITTLLSREEREKGRIDVGAFYARRFFRIAPIYCFVLIIYLFLCSRDDSKWLEMRHALPYYLTFMNEFAVATHLPFGTSWTLGIEEKFYLVWPILFFVLLRGRKRSFILPVLFIATAFMPFRIARSYFGLVAGCSLAAVFAQPSLWRRMKRVGAVPPLALILLIAFGFYLVDLNEKSVFVFSGFVTIFVAHLLSARNWLGRALSSPGFTWVGRRSYSMYLIHGLVLDAVQHFISPTDTARQVVVLAVSFGLCAFGAAVLFRFIEEPARMYGKAVLRKRQSAAAGLPMIRVLEQDPTAAAKSELRGINDRIDDCLTQPT